MKLLHCLFEFGMLFLMACHTGISDLLLKLFFLSEMEIRILGQIIQHLDSFNLAAALLTACNQLIDLSDELLVLLIDHGVSCYQALIKFYLHFYPP